MGKVIGLLFAIGFFVWAATAERPTSEELPAGTCDALPFLCVD